MTDPDPDFAPRPGVPEVLGRGVARILAPNASPMTFRGTNTYLLGEREIAVIDPGPEDPAHLQAILAAVPAGGRITRILVTHAHLDHSAGVPALKRETGAEVLAFGTAEAGRSAVMQRLAAEGAIGGGEGQDLGFMPDRLLSDGEKITAGDLPQPLEVLHTPGHTGNHLSFALGDTLFVGDLVMSWATSLVSPPDGDLTAFLTSLDRLAARDWAVLHSGHGAPVTAPRARLEELSAHRRARHAQIRAALEEAPGSARQLAGRIYTDVPEALLPAAARNVLAHLIDMHEKSQAHPRGPLGAEAIFEPR
ncbi:MBL fold metallo-hydrolase [Roseivivax sp.]